MKMLRLAAGLALCALSFSFAGCAGVQLKPVSIPIMQPKQLAEQVCPVVQADLDILTGAAGAALLTPAQQADVAEKIKPKATAVCEAAETINLTDLQAFNDTAFPALIALVSLVPIPNQSAVLFGLQLAQPILKQIVQNAIALSTSTASTAASSAVPASAPVAASQ
ncbi:hypothetical protein OKW41_006965 [Paraburkholderia sp. UCT70]|uniref:hypothetical protein n=1 Tax=Paraburkholderia sp. UCT70 TaxID=2991068 RepID=UPI003D1E1EA5